MKDPEVLFKVVKRKTRYSAIIPGYSPFAIKYKKGKEVHAIPGTMGIMAFENYEEAYNFATRYLYSYLDSNFKIVRIKPTSKITRKKVVCNLNTGLSETEKLNEYYYKTPKNLKARYHADAINGTVTCQSAIVLD